MACPTTTIAMVRMRTAQFSRMSTQSAVRAGKRPFKLPSWSAAKPTLFGGFKEGFLLQLQKRVCGHPCIRLSTLHIFIPSMEAVGAVASVIAIVTLAQELVALGHELKQSLDKASCAICDQRKTESTLIAPCTRYRLQFVANPLMLRSTSSTLLNSLNPSSEIVGQTSMRPDCMTHCPL